MMSTVPPATVTATSKRIIQKRWVCDVCKTKWFLDFDEACAHEATCTGGASSSHINPKKPIEETKQEKAANKTKEVIEIVDSTDDSDDSPVKLNATRRSKRVRQDTTSNNAAVTAKSSVGTKQGGGTAATTTPSFFKPRAKKSKVSGKKEVCLDDAAKKAPPKKKNKSSTLSDEAATATKKSSKKEMAAVSKTDKSSGISQNFLVEHQTASFFAKRKQAQQEERERQKKREEARRFAKKKGEDGEAGVVTEKATTIAGEDLAVYFPEFSHVFQMDEVTASRDNIRDDTKGYSTLSYPHLKVDLADSTQEETMTNLAFFGKDGPIDHIPDIHGIFSTVFEPSKKKKAATTSTKLWTDKHTISQIPSSILGSSNQQSADRLIKFIEEWKIRRHKSTLIKKSKSKRRKSGYDSDDSFLDDEGGGRTSLFLLTGPTGSGKSRLVHAISSSLDCVVMEINSGEVRGGGVLKRRVLESTQSHSSVALMKKREQNVSSLLGKVPKEKEFFDDETSSDEEEESSSLTVILIDEGDDIFSGVDFFLLLVFSFLIGLC